MALWLWKPEDDELPQPMTLEEVIRRSKSLARSLATEEDEKEIAQAGREVEMEMDEEEIELVEESMKPASLQDSAQGNDATEQPMDEADPPMRIVKNWRRPEYRIPAEKLSLATKREERRGASKWRWQRAKPRRAMVTGHHGQVGARKDGIGHNDGVGGWGDDQANATPK
ncbi:unnamed protein product [Calypogeia fissa]